MTIKAIGATPAAAIKKPEPNIRTEEEFQVHQERESHTKSPVRVEQSPSPPPKMQQEQHEEEQELAGQDAYEDEGEPEEKSPVGA